MVIRPAAVLVAVALFAAGCAPAATPTPKPAATPGAPAAGEIQVSIQGFAFSPQTLTVAPGTTVTWTNKDGAAHTATSQNKGGFDSGSLSQGKAFSYKFSQAGDYTYACTFHPNMTGTVAVK